MQATDKINLQVVLKIKDIAKVNNEMIYNLLLTWYENPQIDLEVCPTPW